MQFPSDAHDPDQQVIQQQWEDTLVETEVEKGQTREVKQVNRATKVDRHGTLNQLGKNFSRNERSLGSTFSTAETNFQKTMFVNSKRKFKVYTFLAQVIDSAVHSMHKCTSSYKTIVLPTK